MRALLLTLFGLIGCIAIFGQNKTDFKNDQELFFLTFKTFGEANEIGNTIMNDFNNGEIPDISSFEKKVNEGIQISKKVSKSYLNSKHSKLEGLFSDYVQSYELTLKIFHEKRNPDEILKIQEDISKKQNDLFSFLEKNQDLFDDQIEVKSLEKSSNSSFKDLLWFFGKVVIAIFPFILGLMLVSMTLFSIALAINQIHCLAVQIYFLIMSMFLLYIYAFLGAYYREVYEIYSVLFNNNWLVYIFCLFGIIVFSSQVLKELKTSKRESELIIDTPDKNNRYSKEYISNASSILFFKGFWMILFSFIIFSFFPNLINTLYGDTANYFASLWLN